MNAARSLFQSKRLDNYQHHHHHRSEAEEVFVSERLVKGRIGGGESSSSPGAGNTDDGKEASARHDDATMPKLAKQTTCSSRDMSFDLQLHLLQQQQQQQQQQSISQSCNLASDHAVAVTSHTTTKPINEEHTEQHSSFPRLIVDSKRKIFREQVLPHLSGHFQRSTTKSKDDIQQQQQQQQQAHQHDEVTVQASGSSACVSLHGDDYDDCSGESSHSSCTTEADKEISAITKAATGAAVATTTTTTTSTTTETIETTTTIEAKHKVSSKPSGDKGTLGACTGTASVSSTAQQNYQHEGEQEPSIPLSPPATPETNFASRRRIMKERLSRLRITMSPSRKIREHQQLGPKNETMVEKNEGTPDGATSSGRHIMRNRSRNVTATSSRSSNNNNNESSSSRRLFSLRQRSLTKNGSSRSVRSSGSRNKQDEANQDQNNQDEPSSPASSKRQKSPRQNQNNNESLASSLSGRLFSPRNQSSVVKNNDKERSISRSDARTSEREQRENDVEIDNESSSSCRLDAVASRPQVCLTEKAGERSSRRTGTAGERLLAKREEKVRKEDGHDVNAIGRYKESTRNMQPEYCTRPQLEKVSSLSPKPAEHVGSGNRSKRGERTVHANIAESKISRQTSTRSERASDKRILSRQASHQSERASGKRTVPPRQDSNHSKSERGPRTIPHQATISSCQRPSGIEALSQRHDSNHSKSERSRMVVRQASGKTERTSSPSIRRRGAGLLRTDGNHVRNSNDNNELSQNGQRAGGGRRNAAVSPTKARDSSRPHFLGRQQQTPNTPSSRRRVMREQAQRRNDEKEKATMQTVEKNNNRNTASFVREEGETNSRKIFSSTVLAQMLAAEGFKTEEDFEVEQTRSYKVPKEVSVQRESNQRSFKEHQSDDAATEDTTDVSFVESPMTGSDKGKINEDDKDALSTTSSLSSNSSASAASKKLGIQIDAGRIRTYRKHQEKQKIAQKMKALDLKLNLALKAIISARSQMEQLTKMSASLCSSDSSSDDSESDHENGDNVDDEQSMSITELPQSRRLLTSRKNLHSSRISNV